MEESKIPRMTQRGEHLKSKDTLPRSIGSNEEARGRINHETIFCVTGNCPITPCKH